MPPDDIEAKKRRQDVKVSGDSRFSPFIMGECYDYSYATTLEILTRTGP